MSLNSDKSCSSTIAPVLSRSAQLCLMHGLHCCELQALKIFEMFVGTVRVKVVDATVALLRAIGVSTAPLRPARLIAEQRPADALRCFTRGALVAEKNIYEKLKI